MAPLASFLVGSLMAARALAQPFDQLFSIPEGWKNAGVAAEDQLMQLKIALKQGDAAGFEQALLDMSTPSHPNYGKHFESHDEMKRMLLPNQDSLSSVYDWLAASGIDADSVDLDADWLSFKTTVGNANKMLETQFAWYSSEDGASKILRTLAYSVPDDVAEHISLVSPTTRFSGQSAHGGQSTELTSVTIMASETDKMAAVPTADCDSLISPQCLNTLYEVDYTPDAHSGSHVAFASYLKEYARHADLALFQENILHGGYNQTFDVVKFNGGLDGQNDTVDDSGEANLDAQYMFGLSYPLPITEYSTGGLGPLIPDLDQPTQADNQNEPYLEFLKGVLKLPKKDLPQVISTSYGENEQSVPKSYAYAVCSLYAQLGSRGVSVIFSSGDSGVGDACLSNDGKNRTMFQPQYPATCPFVTSVGATQGLNETASYFSSGGFSDIWPRPLYQEIAVEKYLASIGDKNKPYYNRWGRGFPDVTAQGLGYLVYDKGSLKAYQGTSCAAPAFGGIVGLLNDARLKAKLPPLGFLNPLLYSNPHALNDITLGAGTGCNGLGRFNGAPNGSPVIPGAAWNATKGWDPVSGLGSPNFPKLLKAAMPLRYRS